MKIEIKIPTIGESITEAVISNILQPTGSVVATDAELLELETDKVNQLLYAPKGGQVTLTVKVGDTVKIGQVIGTIDTDVAAPAPEPKKIEAPVQAPTPAPATTGPSARKTVADFLAEPKKEREAPSKSTAEPSNRKRMSMLRRTIAQKLVEVKNTTALNYTFNEVDMSRIIEIRAKEKESFIAKYNTKLGFMSFFVKASVAAMKAFPNVHAHIEGDEIVVPSVYDIGIAVSTDRGLIVPVVRNCDALNFGEVEQQIDIFVKKTREGTISIDDLRGGSFTITNGGLFGSLLSTGIPPPQQSAIFSMHNIVKRPIAVEDEVVIRPMMYITLSYDHAVVDGREAILFLKHMKDNLEDPTRLLLEL